MNDVMIYGEIGWDVSSASTVRAIMDAAPGPLNVRVNSPGGFVFEGLAIASAIKRRTGVTTYNDGLAASMGSVVFVSGDRRVMAPGTLLMIHNPASGAWGDADDLKKEAAVLDVIAGEMANIYASASGGKVSKEKALEMMDAETWLTPTEAVELGFAHEIEGAAQAFARMSPRMHYRNAPKEVRMPDEVTEPKTGLLDRIMSAMPGGADRAKMQALEAENAQMVATVTEAVAKLQDAEARLADATAKHAQEIESMKAAHAANLETEVAAAKIKGGQEFAAQWSKGNSPDPLPHVETVEEQTTTHSAKWAALYEAGKYEEAAEYHKAHKTEILKGL